MIASCSLQPLLEAVLGSLDFSPLLVIRQTRDAKYLSECHSPSLSRLHQLQDPRVYLRQTDGHCF
jgi:hypothetical protein